jgi:hypothetical protein
MRKIAFLLMLVLTTLSALAQKPLRLGLNFPLRNPETTSIDNYMAHIGGSGAQLYRQMTYADVLWLQVEPQDDRWNFSYSDSIFNRYPQYEYSGNLYSFHVKDNGYQVPWRACKTAGCEWTASRDSAATKDYLKTVINRYKSTITYWDLGNEAEEGGFPSSFPVPDFVRFFAYNYRWIKEIDPNAKVMLPSTLGTYGIPMQQKYDWFRAIFRGGAGNSCDAFGFHDYNSWWTLPIHIDSIINIRNSYGLQSKPLWLTECSISSQRTPITPAYATVDEQAADVWRRSCIAWAKGIEMFIWHGCWSSDVPSEWAEFGLLDHHGTKKKSFHSFRLLADKIIDFDGAVMLSQGTVSDNNDDPNGGNGVWVVKFVTGAQSRYVMWSRNNQTYLVRPPRAIKYRITQVVPETISADGETATFKIDSVIVAANDTYRFSLTGLPILVEELPASSSSDLPENPESAFELFPNPAKDYITVMNCSPKQETFIIRDLTGKLVTEITIGAGQSTRLSTNQWQSGVYMIIPKVTGQPKNFVINK